MERDDEDEADLTVRRSSFSKMAASLLLVGVSSGPCCSSSPSSSSSPSKSSESSATTSGAFGCSISVCASFERLLRNRCRDALDALDVFEDSEEEEMDDEGDSFDVGGGAGAAAGAAVDGFGEVCSAGFRDPCGAHWMLGDACCRRGSVSSSVSSPGGRSCWAWTSRVVVGCCRAPE